MYKKIFHLFFLSSLLFHSGFGQSGRFVDITAEAGFPRFGYGHGLAVGDYDNDGFEDLYVSVYTGKNRLCRNKGDGTFQEVAADLGLDIASKSKSAVWGDIDNDGYLDLYVANLNAKDQLFRNLGDGTFNEITLSARISNIENPSAVNMADVNGDGFLDIYIANFGAENILYLNNQDLTFRDYTLAAGLSDTGSSMGAIFFDYDKDGDSDLYLVHDNIEPNFLFQNDGTGHFTEVSISAKANSKGYGMGVDVADINQDGYADIYITNLFKNVLLLNQGDGTFEDISDRAGIEDFGMGWGTHFTDVDNDGWVDIYVANDSEFSPYPNVLYRNLGDTTFEKIETTSPISSMQQSFASVGFDYNLDGSLDLAVANIGESDYCQLFENQRIEGNWVGFKLIGANGNSQAIGAKVEIVDELGAIHYKELTAGSGWASQSSAILHLGLGDAEHILDLRITWPSGNSQVIEDLAPNQYWTIEEGDTPVLGLISKPLLTANTEVIKRSAEMLLQLFPNPNSGEIQVEFESVGSGPIQLQLFSVDGKLLRNQWLDDPTLRTGSLKWDLKDLAASGFFFIRLSNESQAVIKRMLVLK